MDGHEEPFGYVSSEEHSEDGVSDTDEENVENNEEHAPNVENMENNQALENYIDLNEENLENDMDDEEDVESNNDTADVTNAFDITLPASHSYLGQDLQELSGRTVLDGIHMNLPLLVSQSLMLFPEETLPMMVHETQTIEMLRNCIENDRTFGVVCISYRQDMVPVGTTAEIYEYTESSTAGFCVKAKGRQRFKVLRVIVEGHNKIFANIKVLPEVTLPHPLAGQRVISLDNIRIRATNEEELLKQKKVETMDAALSPWPAWVYRQYDPVRLSIQMRDHLRFIKQAGCNMPANPTDLSFWVAQNLILDGNVKIMLLNYDCAIQRLQMEIKILTEKRSFVCCKCDSYIAQRSDIFLMNADGPQSAYCNPGGFIHETITLYRAKGLKLARTGPSTDCSWFPGYGWTVANCKTCGIHMGWKFTAVNESLRPKSFWGLIRTSLRSEIWK